MQKNNFMQGAFIATFGIVISKILGILYVIPFYAIIGEKGGALYGYAYNIYSIFLGISTAGLPLAMSKIISEYHTLGYEEAKRRAFKLGSQVAIVLGIIGFIVLFLFAPQLAHLIIGNVQGGNTVGDIALVIRIISTAVIVVPVLSVFRGYFQGHKYIAPTSFSQILEQVVRVLIIVIGSYLALRVFHLSLSTAVGIAVFGATAGALASYLYLVNKMIKNRKLFRTKLEGVKEPRVATKEIVAKLVMYCIPFVMIDLFRSLYDSVDMVTLVKTLVNGLGYSSGDAESIMSVISTWGSKFNMIVMSVATGCMVSLIPNMTESFVSGDLVDVRRKVNKTLQVIFYVTVPMTVGICVLAKPIWGIFYGASTYGPSVVAYFIFVALATALFTSTITIVQLLKEYKTVFLSLIVGIGTKILLNIPLLYGFSKMGLPAYYGSITATILGFVVSSMICLIQLHRKYRVEYEDTVKQVMNIVGATLIMLLVLLLLHYVLPSYSSHRLMNLPIVIGYSLLGALIYFGITWKSGTLQHILGKNTVSRILGKFRRKK